MSTGLEICQKIGNANKLALHLKGIRFKGGYAYASDLCNTIKTKTTLITGDCLVDTDDFMKAIKATNTPEIVLGPQTVTIKEKKFKADMMLMDAKKYNLDLDKEPKGLELDPKGFLMALKRIWPFLKLANNEAWIFGDHLYVRDTPTVSYVVRTPIDCDLSKVVKDEEQEDVKPLTITKDFADLLLSVEEKPTKIVVTSDSITVVFEDTWIESLRFSPDRPVNLPQVLNQSQDLPVQPFPDDVHEGLKMLCDFASAGDQVNFSPLGINLMKAGRCTYNISHPSTPMAFDAMALKLLISLKGLEFNQASSIRLYFKSPDIEGLWGALRSDASDEELAKGGNQPKVVQQATTDAEEEFNQEEDLTESDKDMKDAFDRLLT